MRDQSRHLLRRLDDRLLGSARRVYERTLTEALRGYGSALDVGCGTPSPIADLIAGMVPRVVGVDGDAATVERCRAGGPYDEYHCADAREIGALFGTDAFDVVVALDVIEHFDKPDGWVLLDALEAVARRRVVVFTPNGFLRQGEKDDNPLQVHRSGWRPEEFAARDYAVSGINGWKPLRGELWEPRIRPASIGHRLSACSQPLVTRRPRLAFQLLAVRDLC